MSNARDMDPVFRALADPGRRRILDLLKAEAGLNVNELCRHFEFTRFGVMKHLAVLEAADLVVARREGRNKRLYLNAIPLQLIHDRWMSQYSALWAPAITSVKHELEEEFMSEAPRHVYVSYIRTSPAKLWEAITDARFTRQYFHRTEVESDWKVGSQLRYVSTNENGKKSASLRGEILECEPQRRLVHSFEFAGNDDAPSRVSYEIEPAGDAVKLTIVHDGFAGKTETFTSTAEGWPPIIAGLKTLLETGEPLGLPGHEC